jgi:hypothetical protein
VNKVSRAGFASEHLSAVSCECCVMVNETTERKERRNHGQLSKVKSRQMAILSHILNVVAEISVMYTGSNQDLLIIHSMKNNLFHWTVVFNAASESWRLNIAMKHIRFCSSLSTPDSRLRLFFSSPDCNRLSTYMR